MKKFASVILVLALALSLSIPAFAETYTYIDGDKPEVEVFFTLELPAPTYTVDIPATIALELDEMVSLPFQVLGLDKEALSGRKIVITMEDASTGNGWSSNEQFALHNTAVTGDEYYKTLGYRVWEPDMSGFSYSLIEGWILMEFTDNGTQYLGFRLVNFVSSSIIELSKISPVGKYTGYITFGIKVV